MELEQFKKEVDEWIKEIYPKVQDIELLKEEFMMCSNNIDHNNEFILSLSRELNNMKEEISALRLVQLLSLKESKLRRRTNWLEAKKI